MHHQPGPLAEIAAGNRQLDAGVGRSDTGAEQFRRRVPGQDAVAVKLERHTAGPVSEARREVGRLEHVPEQLLEPRPAQYVSCHQAGADGLGAEEGTPKLWHGGERRGRRRAIPQRAGRPVDNEAAVDDSPVARPCACPVEGVRSVPSSAPAAVPSVNSTSWASWRRSTPISSSSRTGRGRAARQHGSSTAGASSGDGAPVTGRRRRRGWRRGRRRGPAARGRPARCPRAHRRCRRRRRRRSAAPR